MDEQKMPGTRPLLSEVEMLLKKRFEKSEADKKHLYQIGRAHV